MIFHQNGAKMEPIAKDGGSLFPAFWRARSFLGLPGSFWHPPGSLLAPRGCLWAPFSLPLAPFWLPLAPFGLTLAIFWLAFAHPKATFSNFCGLLPSFLHFFEFPMKILRKICFLFRKLSLENQVVRQPNRSTPKTAERTPTEIKSSFAPHRSRTRSGNLPKAT